MEEQRGKRARGTGRIFQPRGCRFLHIRFYNHGQQVQMDTRTADARKAEKILRRKLREVEAGDAPSPGSDRITYENLRNALLADYRANGRRWLRRGRDGKPYVVGLAHLGDYFAGWRALEIDADSVRAYTAKRLEAGAKGPTINRELALLRRMFRLAIEDGKLRSLPHFAMLAESRPRTGFLGHGSYQKLRAELPEHLRPVLATGYYTGMRLGEVLGLRWANVDLGTGEIRLEAGTTKNGEGRTVPIAGEVLEMLHLERERNPESEFVFTHEGERVKSFYKAWKSATKRAGLEGLLFHDLRRTGVRNLVRAGVPERVAMAVSGFKTRAVFERYNIVSGRDLREAAAKLEVYLSSQNGENSGKECTDSGAASNDAICNTDIIQ